MKCPKCGYVSHDYLEACRKCSVDLVGYKAQMQLHVVQVGQIDLRSALGEGQPSPTASGEFEMGEALFDSPMLVDAHGSDGFDINLDDDFSFTPSAMSLESMDGFEISNLDGLSREQSPPPGEAGDDETGTVPPDTGYATVMMDLTNVNDETPSLDVGPSFDEPIESAVNTTELSIDPPGEPVSHIPEAPIEPDQAGIEFPDLPADDILIEPDLTSAELRSSIMGRTADLDITSMELKRTTQDIEMLNQLKAEAEAEATSPDPISPQDDDDHVVIDLASDDPIEADWAEDDAIIPEAPSQASASPADDVLAAELSPDTSELDFSALDDDDASPINREGLDADLDTLDTVEAAAVETDLEATLPVDTSPSYTPGLPGVFPDEPDDPEDLNSESGELILPSLDSQFLADDATASPLTDSAVDIAAEPLELPDLPDAAEEEASPSMYTEEMSLINGDLMDADSEPPLDFPSLQTGVFSAPTPEETTLVDEQSVQQPTMKDDPAEPPQAEFDKTELELGNPDAPKITDAFLAATPEEATIADEQPPPLPIEPAAAQDATAPPEGPLFPDLPEPTDEFLTPSPEEATIVDEQPPQLPTGQTPVNFNVAPPDTGYATVELNLDHEEAPEAPLFPDLPEPTDEFLTPSPEEATIVDEQPPQLPTGQTPVNFNVAPPDTGYATVELNLDHEEAPEAPLFPDLPEPTDEFLTPSPEEATIVDEQPPQLPGGHVPPNMNLAPPDTAEKTLQLDISDIDGILDSNDEVVDPKSSAPDAQKPNRGTDPESSR